MAFDRPWVLEARHRFAWGFQSQERQFIQHWESQLHNPDIKWVAFRKYQQTVLQAVAQGDVTPLEGATVMGLVEQYRRVLETTELERRISALEAAK